VPQRLVEGADGHTPVRGGRQRRLGCDRVRGHTSPRPRFTSPLLPPSAAGTPLQNRVGELFSLIRFLRPAPYAHYFCKNCPCVSLDYKFDEGGRQCEICGHSPLRHYQWMNRCVRWVAVTACAHSLGATRGHHTASCRRRCPPLPRHRSYVLNEIKKWGYAGPGRDALLVLRREVLGGLLLRRTKAGRAADLALPSRLITIRDDLELDELERDYYEALYTQSRARFGAYVQAGTLLSNYAHIFDLLTVRGGWGGRTRCGGAAMDETAGFTTVCRVAVLHRPLIGHHHLLPW
jgi:hypothetical protein